jgi:uncharacterized Ntn-hydrolase superfamily protein
MTWSIVVREPATDRFGIGISTRFLAVGALCPWTRAHVGAVATQAQVNPLYGPAVLDAMAAGVAPGKAIEAAVRGDAGEAWRQVHAVDARGRSFARTGTSCTGWCGHRHLQDVSVAGNMLTGPEVIEATLEAYFAGPLLPLAERLLTALDAGQAAGGDKRGRQSAALRIQGPELYAELDLRVDNHAEPLAELRRVYQVAKDVHLPFRAAMPTAANPSGIFRPEAREPFLAARREELLGSAP